MPSYLVTKERFGAPWPCVSHIKNWEQQWKIGSRTSEQQQQTEKAATSSAAAKQQQKEVMEEGEITTDEESEIGNTGKTLAEQAKIVTLVHSRELLQEVICPWENVQLFIRHFFADHSPLHNCLAIFRIDEKMNHGENLPTTGVYIDQIGEIKNDTVTFKHLGSFEFNSIRPYSAGPIGDEDFEKWLDMLIHAGEELPETIELFERKNKIMQWCSEQQKIFNCGIMAKKKFPDLSSIILKGQGPICKMLKFGQSDAFNVLCGLCIQVDISQIRHSIKLPPLMNLLKLKYMFIPITTVTFDAPKPYKIHSMNSYFCNVLLHSKNENGDVLCSFNLPQLKTQMSNEQLIQISLAIWAMNNIPMPTAEYIERKAVQLQQALLLSDKITLPGTVGRTYNTILPIGPPPLLLNQKGEQSNGGKWILQKFGKKGRRLKWFWIPILNKPTFKKQHEKTTKMEERKLSRTSRNQRWADVAKLHAADVVEANKENRKITKHHSVRNQLDIVPSYPHYKYIDEPDYTGN